MIDEFSGPYSFLSNFYVEPDGSHVEGEYQASKSPLAASRFIGLSPYQAKTLGREIKLRKDWEKVKFGTMLRLVRRKFQDHPGLAAKLEATGDQPLIEGNHWNDTYWGVCDGVGENNLGIILMMVRYELSQGVTAPHASW